MNNINKSKEQLIKELAELRQENQSLKLQVSETYKIETDLRALNQENEALLEIRNRYNELMDQSRDAIFSLSPQGLLISLNKAFEHITGWQVQEWHGKPFVDLLHPEDIPLALERFSNILKGNTGQALELRIIKKSGDYLYAELLASLWIKKGMIVGLLGIARDITERKMVEEKLRISEEKFFKLFHSSPDAIIVTELKNGRIIEVNKSFEMFSGFSSDELIGHQVLEFNMYGQAERQRFVSMLQKLGSFYDVEFELKNKAGKELKVLSSAVLFEIDGEAHTITILKDITGRKLAEEALRESERKARAIFDLSFGFIGLLTPEGTILEVNRTALEFAGIQLPEVIGKPFWETPWWSHSLEVKNQIREAIKAAAKGEFIRAETTHPAKDGTLHTIDFTLKPVLNEKGQVMFLIPEGRDITEWKLAEAALQQSEEKFRLLTEKSIVGIYIIQDAKLAYVNPSFAKMLGYSPEEIIGILMPNDLIHKEDIQIVMRRLQERLEGKIEDNNVVYRALKKDGSIIYIEVYGMGVEYQGRPAVMGTLIDVTQTKKAEQELIKAKERAEESDLLKTAFMNNISHEVRTPLNGILGFAQFVLQPDISEEEKSYYLDVLNTCSERLLNTITDYMDISLIVSGNVKVHKQPLILSRLLNEIYDKFQTKCKAKKLEFIKQIPSETNDSSLQIDASLLEKSISHLVDNAIKFTQAGSVILGFRFKNSEYEIFVKDTGSGINQDAQNKIFDFFIQEESSDSRGYEGSGLGLSIVKGLVELMGGKIRLESVKGEGSTFFITLTAEKGIIDKIESPEIKQPKSGSKISPVVLIADDDEVSFAFHKTILENASLEYLIARNGLEAVEICRDKPEISIVLMDIKMPVMDGLEATQKIREFRKDLTIIGVTAYAMAGDKEKVIAAGCDDYITKPVQSDLLLSVINKYL